MLHHDFTALDLTTYVGIRSFGMVGSFEHLANTLYITLPKTNVGAPEKWWLGDDPWGRSIFSGRGP